MIAHARHIPSEPEAGVLPAMDGAADDEVFAFADHLKRHAPLGIDGKEALRRANAQQAEFRAATTRKAVEIAMRELLQGLKAA